MSKLSELLCVVVIFFSTHSRTEIFDQSIPTGEGISSVILGHYSAYMDSVRKYSKVHYLSYRCRLFEFERPEKKWGKFRVCVSRKVKKRKIKEVLHFWNYDWKIGQFIFEYENEDGSLTSTSDDKLLNFKFPTASKKKFFFFKTTMIDFKVKLEKSEKEKQMSFLWGNYFLKWREFSEDDIITRTAIGKCDSCDNGSWTVRAIPFNEKGDYRFEYYKTEQKISTKSKISPAVFTQINNGAIWGVVSSLNHTLLTTLIESYNWPDGRE